MSEPDYKAAEGQIVKLIILAEESDPLANDTEFWAKLIVDAALPLPNKETPNG